MCGICGFVEFEPSRPLEETQAILARMNRTMVHRGPDDEGYIIDGPAALAMRRLSVIDLATGHQPLSNADGTVWIVFNGEIYNYRELRASLIKKGYTFKTHSDTETILHLYEEKGEAFVDDLNGMFGIAIWDSRKQELFLARDRFGKKPLYYAPLPGGGIAFASELKALIQHPRLRRELDPDALALFLGYDYVPYPYSIFRGIRKLPPAALLRLKSGIITERPYWNLPFEKDRAALPHDEEALVPLLRDKLRRAVEYRLESDVPLGVFLSGGLDSSLITALMCQLRPAHEVQTFSVHFEEKSFDESAHSDRVARHLGTCHRSEHFRSRDLIDLVPKIGAAMDEPFADASIFPTYLLSAFTRRHVTVALCGDGADELFAGYPTFQAGKLVRPYLALPACIRRAFECFVARLPASTENFSLDFKLKQFLAGVHASDARREQAWLAPFTPPELASLLTPAFRASLALPDPYQLLDTVMAGCDSRHSVDRTSYFYAKFYMAEGILTKSDRAAMANSLETRSPYLDKDVATFIAALPPALKLRRFTTKYLLKKAARGLLPDVIIDRPKKGFGVPVAHWFRDELKDFLRDHLNTRWMRESGIFDRDVIDRLFDEHVTGRRDHRKKLFPLLMLSLWQENYLP